MCYLLVNSLHYSSSHYYVTLLQILKKKNINIILQIFLSSHFQYYTWKFRGWTDQCFFFPVQFYQRITYTIWEIYNPAIIFSFILWLKGVQCLCFMKHISNSIRLLLSFLSTGCPWSLVPYFRSVLRVPNRITLK